MKPYCDAALAMKKLISDIPQTEPEDLRALLPEVNVIMCNADFATEQAMRSLAGRIETKDR